jgi:hypothetical protein
MKYATMKKTIYCHGLIKKVARNCNCPLAYPGRRTRE